ncbi:MAG: hypothetical protein KAW12_22715 [Candidatus Aminicenantes bacterium]|nr:hypothetical protein [Candidatus Aminicenantes bacterium]
MNACKKYFLIFALILFFFSACKTNQDNNGSGDGNGDDNGSGDNGNGVPTQRLQPEDLTYLGAFRLPGGTSIVKSWQWGGFAMTYYSGGDPNGPDDGYPGSIFGSGHAWEHQVSEISIPAPKKSTAKNLAELNTASALQNFPETPPAQEAKNLNEMNTAGTLQAFRDIYDVGHLEIPRSGLAYLPKKGDQNSGKLYFCKGEHLLDDENFLTHGWCELNLSAPQIKGDWYIDCPHGSYNTNDYMFEIPASWAALHTPGKLLGTGRYRDGGWSGEGPALFAIAPWDQGNPPAPGTSIDYITLLRYTSSLDFDEEEHTMTGYHHSDEWSGAEWLTAGDKAALVFVGTKGTGDCWYGDENGPCYDCEGERGWWSTGFAGQFIFYDPADLAEVAAGTKEAYEPQPYAVLEIDQYLYHIGSSQQWYHLGAACFDRAGGLFYVFEPYVDDDKPIVHVWRVEE